MMFPSVLGVMPTERAGAVEAYRLIYPMNMMAKLGYQTMAVPATVLGEALIEGSNIFEYFDVIQFHGFLAKPEEFEALNQAVIAFRQVGKTVLVDFDDDMTNVHRKVSDYEIPDLSNFSGITVSTPYLRSVMTRYHRNVRVISNLVPPEMFMGWKRVAGDGPVIGLSGSTTHVQDWKAVVEPVKAVLARHPEAKLFCSGHVPEEFKGMEQLITLKTLFPDKTQDVEGDDFYIPLKEYGGILRNVDILLCPVDPSDKFNWSKSNLKAIEGQLSARDINGVMGGCFVIATGDLPNYQDAIRNNRTGVLVNHNDGPAWEKVIENALVDVEFRHAVQVAGYRSALKSWDIHKRIGERVATYTDFIAMDRKAQHKLGSVAALAT